MKIAVIDDAPDVAEVVGLCFEVRWPGTKLLVAQDGPTGLSLVRRENPDLVVLDIGLPEMDGYQVLREIRGFSQVPVIILSVKDQDTDIARGLELGADDYITKPFSHIALLARAQAVLRRTQAAPGSDEPPFISDSLRVDFASREVWTEGGRVKLTPMEFTILYHLVKSANRVVSQRELVTKVWGPESADAPRYLKVLKVHIQHLREKLGDEAGNPRIISTEWGIGYRLLNPPSSGGVS